MIDGTCSDPALVCCGNPQGSVLGSLLSALYYAPLEDVITAHGIDATMYANDPQLYVVLKQSNRSVCLKQL